MDENGHGQAEEKKLVSFKVLFNLRTVLHNVALKVNIP